MARAKKIDTAASVIDENLMELIGDSALDGEVLPSFSEMPLSVVDSHKKFLAEKKKQLALRLDNQKLDEAVKVIGGMESITDIITDKEVMQRVKDNTGNAQDIKFLAEAYSKLADKMQMLQRLDTVDGNGTGGRIMLQLEDGNGNSIKMEMGGKG